jgi:hypothetical protein
MYNKGMYFIMILNVNEPCRTFKKNKIFIFT